MPRTWEKEGWFQSCRKTIHRRNFWSSDTESWCHSVECPTLGIGNGNLKKERRQHSRCPYQAENCTLALRLALSYARHHDTTACSDLPKPQYLVDPPLHSTIKGKSNFAATSFIFFIHRYFFFRRLHPSVFLPSAQQCCRNKVYIHNIKIKVKQKINYQLSLQYNYQQLLLGHSSLLNNKECQEPLIISIIRLFMHSDVKIIRRAALLGWSAGLWKDRQKMQLRHNLYCWDMVLYICIWIWHVMESI